MKLALFLAAPLLGLAELPSTTTAAADALRTRGDFEKAKAKVVKKAADDLCSVARWCDKQKYYLERDRVYELALTLVPDHRKAREALKYVKGEDGEWVQSDDFVPERNHGRVDIEALQEKERKVWERWADALVDQVHRHSDELSPEEYERELRAVLVRFPDHALVRKRLGYVEGWQGRPWVSPAAKRAHERRKAITASAKKRREDASEPVESELEGYETEMGIGWIASMEHERARILSTAGKKDVSEGLEIVWAAPDFVADVLGARIPLPAGYVAYLVETKEHFPVLLEHVPGARASRVEGVASWWATGSKLIVGSDQRVNRIDLLSKQTVGNLLNDAYGLSAKQGWAWEGFSIYLSYKLCGTRLSFSVRATEYEDKHDANTRSRLRASDANWLKMAHDVMAGEKPPTLPFLLGKDVNQLSGEDLLVGYGLAAYILEGHAELAPKILRRLPNEAAVTVLEQELGMKLETIQAKLTEWLDEVN